MLVLARQRDQSVIIGDEIEVTVVDVRGDKVRLGINAPRNVTVHRKEIYDAIRRENQSASNVRPEDLLSGPPGSGAKPINGAANPSMRMGPDPQALLAAHRPFMEAALAEARGGLAEGGLPIGSVLVRDGEILARAHDRRVQSGDPMAHAEIACLSRAGRQSSYKDTTLYSTLMPCYLCSGAAVQSGIPRIVVGESTNFAGAADFLRKQKIEVIDLHDPDCTQLMGSFIKEHPKLWNEQSGQ